MLLKTNWIRRNRNICHPIGLKLFANSKLNLIKAEKLRESPLDGLSYPVSWVNTDGIGWFTLIGEYNAEYINIRHKILASVRFTVL